MGAFYGLMRFKEEVSRLLQEVELINLVIMEWKMNCRRLWFVSTRKMGKFYGIEDIVIS
jgi:hypothetical protein